MPTDTSPMLYKHLTMVLLVCHHPHLFYRGEGIIIKNYFYFVSAIYNTMRKSVSKAFHYNLKQMCMPSYVYIVLSCMAIFATITFQIITGMNCSIAQNTLLMTLQIVYTLFWAWILHLICKNGYSTISWILVISPIISGITLSILMSDKYKLV